MEYMLILLVAGYLLGSINTALAVSKVRYGEDIRTKGSGNAGLTNALRVYGKGAALMVLLGDVAKAIVASLLGILVHNTFMASGTSFLIGGQGFVDIYGQIANTGVIPGAMFACFGAILGHNWPLYFKFKGGKGVLVSAVTIFVLSWKLGLICMALFVILVAIFKYVSLGSISAAICYPISVLVATLCGWQYGSWWYFGFALVVGVLVVYSHRSNISRLIAGNEKKLKF
ncbi:MAG: glycerol-3-phosphate 1-O-acyltransferase PlsY [Clostridia bacterium]|nr:glycerol-3-phosphate 1-O-acyltransferase PlsY [Clostridia bacterium]